MTSPVTWESNCSHGWSPSGIPACADCQHDRKLWALVEGRTDDPVERALDEVRSEVVRATGKFAALNSPHEGYAVIAEELDELWEHVRANTGRGGDARKEARQTAAMAVRYMLDLAVPA